MSPEATEDEVQAVIDRIESVGGTAHPSRGAELTLIGAIGDADTELPMAISHSTSICVTLKACAAISPARSSAIARPECPLAKRGR